MRSSARLSLKYSNEPPRTSQLNLQTNISDSEDSDYVDDKSFKPLNDKPTSLYEEDLDVEGKEMYKFCTPKKRNSMALLTKVTPRLSISRLKSLSLESPKSKVNTPRSKKSKNYDFLKTPHHVRQKVKKEIKRLRENVDSDFSSDESEYEPNSSENDYSSSNIESESDSQSKSKLINKVSQKKDERKVSPLIIKLSGIKTKNITIKNRKTEDYIPECEEYFTAHSSNKKITSDHTLDKLKNPRLPTDELFNLLSSLNIPKNHEKVFKSLFEEYRTNFNKWMFILNEGYNLLLYGLGSKREILQTFHKEMLTNEHVIVVNGFFPTITIKEIVDSISNDILELNMKSINIYEIIHEIKEKLSFLSEIHIFLIIHNIDGTTLRNSKAQDILSFLAKIPNIHLIASVDHINAPLLWDQTKLTNFNFSWWDITTMLPYSEEIAYENSLLVQNSGESTLASLRNVFPSLTKNAKGIFMVIVKHQLENKKNSNYNGIQFKELYWSCREAFLVNSDLTLRAQLTEFLDHKLIKTKRTMDGSEHLLIPLEANLLEIFWNEQK